MLKFMLDTNICIYVIKRKPITALNKFNENAGQICISSMTLAELVHGAERSERKNQNMRVIEDFRFCRIDEN